MKKVNLEDVRNDLRDINNYYEGIYNLDVEYDKECRFSERPLYYITDENEEFYYDSGYGCFDYCFEKVERVVKKYFGDKAYLDCMCPGRWIVGE